ncbi:baseplate J/gp47 family protein [Marinomonas sp. PE14-40]|uniref:baseplate J/gp47 family protein n=1 Tax=Marinomonas sp. PE14-40 TaxID=3060621 RepID=UPI003F67CFDD
MSDFEKVLTDSGVPTTEETITAEFKTALQESGSTISNDSIYSPFWRLISALITKPVLWLINELLIKQVMPQFYLKTVGEGLIEWWGDNRDCVRKQAQTLKGNVLFSRLDTSNALLIPAGTKVYTESINNTVYNLFTLEDSTLASGEGALLIKAKAEMNGEAYNLESGYFNKCDIEGVAVVNPENWISVLGADLEDIEDYRLRIRNMIHRLSHFHTDGVYKSLISEFGGVQEDAVWFEHNAPRGAGTANAYILFDLDAPANSYLETINRRISDEGYHGHGDDLLVLAMPETFHSISVKTYLPISLLDVEIDEIHQGVEGMIRAAFRENKAYANVTLTLPQSRFSFSKLAREIYAEFPELEDLVFSLDGIESGLTIPRINTLTVERGE